MLNLEQHLPPGLFEAGHFDCSKTLVHLISIAAKVLAPQQPIGALPSARNSLRYLWAFSSPSHHLHFQPILWCITAMSWFHIMNLHYDCCFGAYLVGFLMLSALYLNSACTGFVVAVPYTSTGVACVHMSCASPPRRFLPPPSSPPRYGEGNSRRPSSAFLVWCAHFASLSCSLDCWGGPPRENKPGVKDAWRRCYCCFTDGSWLHQRASNGEKSSLMKRRESAALLSRACVGGVSIMWPEFPNRHSEPPSCYFLTKEFRNNQASRL